MRAFLVALSVSAALAALPANGHGPQIQITNDNGKIVTRSLLQNAPYSTALTSPKSVYVIPILKRQGVWYARPNNAPHPNIPGEPEFYSGPGFAYGYGWTSGGPQAFATGSIISADFLDGLKRWDGAAFVDAGVTEIKAFRGNNVNVSSPPQNFAITSDSGPLDSVSLDPVQANYGTEGVDVHNTIRFALLGDGASPTSDSPDGVYLLKQQVSSTQPGLSASEPYYFVLHKNAGAAVVRAAVDSLGYDADLVQFVPEPAGWLLVAIGVGPLLAAPRIRRRRPRE